jgi:hypothetical protein
MLFNRMMLSICAGIILSACSKNYTVDDFRKDPSLAEQVTQTCLQLAEVKKNPFKNESCHALVYFEREQCQQSGNYFEANHCDEPLYLLSRANLPRLPKGAL